MVSNLVYHSLIRALLSLALKIMSVQLTLAAGKDQLTPGKSGKFFFFFFTLCLFIKHYHYFWCGECNFFVCLFVWICLAFSVFVLFYLFIYFFVVGGVVLFVLFFLFSFCCCFYVLFCFCFWIFGLSCSPLRHFPSVFYLFLPIAVTSYKRCVNILAGYTSMLGVISRGKCIYIVEPVLRLAAPTQ